MNIHQFFFSVNSVSSPPTRLSVLIRAHKQLRKMDKEWGKTDFILVRKVAKAIEHRSDIVSIISNGHFNQHFIRI